MNDEEEIKELYRKYRGNASWAIRFVASLDGIIIQRVATICAWLPFFIFVLDTVSEYMYYSF